MHPIHYKHKTSVRESPIVQSQSPLAPYWPNGNVAAPPDMIVSPLSHSPGSFPGNGTANALVGQVAAEWITPRQSLEQGAGVPAFKRWPRQFHSEAYNFSTLAIMPQADQVAPVPTGPGQSLIVNNAFQRRIAAGWSMPSYGEQYEQPIAAAGLGTGVANIADPANVAYAIGWGYVG